MENHASIGGPVGKKGDPKQVVLELQEHRGYYLQVQAKINIHLITSLSRVIWKMVTGNDPKEVIDHIHGLKGGNVYSNFQDITQQQNMAKKIGEIIND
jgi:hypothetical protein